MDSSGNGCFNIIFNHPGIFNITKLFSAFPFAANFKCVPPQAQESFLCLLVTNLCTGAII